jgi:hypothetical protein
LIKKLERTYIYNDIKNNDILNIQETSKYDIINNNEINNKFYIDMLYENVQLKYALFRNKASFKINKFIGIYNNISNLTNCIDGGFHDFKYKDLDLLSSDILDQCLSSQSKFSL